MPGNRMETSELRTKSKRPVTDFELFDDVQI